MKTAFLFAAAVLSVSATAMADTYIPPQVQDVLVEVCSNTQTDDRLSLRKTLHQNRLSKKAAVTKVVCNGQALMDFARSSNANKVVAMLSPYEQRAKVSISDLVAP
ncbi:DUF3718 domain-containing protein [Rheinheimera sp.]|jgi:hypothetical protein|uniref:DUF3718 domain-containing protein n=1 Tax=Rheinheimera sp. TaxID=1869214 RepID=UPI002632A983|nr:DUF3718 domain-containing protein [Rheinheimera sp.]MCA1929929.1 DUF3718 domain-containing protein [Rheinheimera sp.]